MSWTSNTTHKYQTLNIHNELHLITSSNLLDVQLNSTQHKHQTLNIHNEL